MNEVFISKDDNEKPEIKVLGNAKKMLEEKCGEKYKIHVSLSHEKEYALAFVVIEIIA